jgi:hypothetical protein
MVALRARLCDPSVLGRPLDYLPDSDSRGKKDMASAGRSASGNDTQIVCAVFDIFLVLYSSATARRYGARSAGPE